MKNKLLCTAAFLTLAMATMAQQKSTLKVLAVHKINSNGGKKAASIPGSFKVLEVGK